jgi:NADPH-dependent 2,4-dienoyl-CoA reductase/sulfur reductase-like enzyme
MERPTSPKKVAVVGGGPAGLEAARMAALKGHSVTLYEKDAECGGLINVVSRTPRVYMAELHNIVEWELHQLAGLPVDLRLGVEATPDRVRQDGAEVVILACGAKMVPLAVPGADAPHVVGLLDYLTGKAAVGKRVVVVGGHEGAEAALSLARQGHQVLLLEAGDHIADAAYLKYCGRQMMLQEMLQEAGVQVVTGAVVRQVTPTGVVAMLNGVEWTAPADSVVVALGRQADPALAAAWQGAAPQVLSVGDCLEPESVRNAIHTAARAALNL